MNNKLYTPIVKAINMNVSEKQSTPVRIVFDRNSQRIDILTGRQVPNHNQAISGSIRFFEGRLDKQVENINYMFASMVSVNINNLILMRKLSHPNIWALVSKNGGTIEGLDPVMSADVVKIYAVSFIPLNPSTKHPEARLHVLLEDMYLIQWEELNHWLAIKSQTEYEAEQGTRY